ncbi:MAG TPA: glycosyl hydrolase family 8, partial [Myxococcota bacterium]|nr:glycosyl hydrolase family 8 [Myxococcota bacterium]
MTLWLSLLLVATPADERTSDRYLRQLDELSALWSRYEFDYVKDGRVVELDERGITTSEAQSYGMLRAVWQRDKEAFSAVWR